MKTREEVKWSWCPKQKLSAVAEMLTLEISLILIMLCGEFVWDKDAGLYLGLVQQTQMSKLRFFLLFFSFYWVMSRNKAVLSGLRHGAGKGPWHGSGCGSMLQGLIPEACLWGALHRQQKSCCLSPEPQMAVATLGDHARASCFMLQKYRAAF